MFKVELCLCDKIEYMFDHDHYSGDNYGEILARNAGSLGLDGEMLDLLRKNKTRETVVAQEKPSIGIEQIRFIMVRGIVLRCSYGEKGIQEVKEGTRGDGLAIYNVLEFLNRDSKPQLWDLIEETEKNLNTIQDLDLQRYIKAIESHIQKSIASDLGRMFGSKDTFDLVFSNIEKLQRNLPIVNLIELGERPSLPYDIDRYYGFGKIGSDSYFEANQYLQSINLTRDELEAIWTSLKPQLSGVPLVDKQREHNYWGQELLFKKIVEAYMLKVSIFLSEQEG